MARRRQGEILRVIRLCLARSHCNVRLIRAQVEAVAQGAKKLCRLEKGTANKDFWRGTTSSRNADANDPLVLSNTLPFGKFEYPQSLPQVNRLRERVVKSKSPQAPGQVVVSALSLCDGVGELAALQAGGALSLGEFEASKAAFIAQHRWRALRPDSSFDPTVRRTTRPL